MSGSWEGVHDRVLVGILHVDQTTVAWAFGLRNLQIPGNICGVAGLPFDHARNAICTKALQEGYTHVFMLDSDVIAPPDTILRLLRHGKPIISGVYCRRSPPHGVPVMIRGGQWITQYPENSVIEVDVVGSGCLLIDCDLLRSLPPTRPGKNWFDWRVDMRGTGVLPDEECLSEDFTYCTHVRKHGIPILVDTSIMCRHIGSAEAGYGVFKPLETVA